MNRILNKIIDKDIQPKLLSVRARDVFRTLADITKIKTILDFEPKVNFEEWLRKTVKYFEEKIVAAHI